MNKAINSHGEIPHGVIPHGTMPPVDLHVHSNRSDGTFSPSQLVDYAIEKGLAAFALTDHDTIDGLEEAIFYAASLKSGQNKIPSALPAESVAAASYFSSASDKPAYTAETATAASYPPSAPDKPASTAKPDTAAPYHPSASDKPAYTAKPDTAAYPPSASDKPAYTAETVADAYPSLSAPDKPASTAESDTAALRDIRLPLIPEVIPGIEFSTEYQGQDVHIVGLYIDYHNETFRKQLQDFVASRESRNRKMCRLLQEHGIEVTYEDLLTEFPDAVITRAHYAKYMLNHGYIKSMKEAFERYIDDHGPCYVPREKVTPEQAVKLILAADGIPILAHPILYHMSDDRLDTLTATLKSAGLVGIEAIYSTYTTAEERQIRVLAAKYDLLISGGSDFHGANKPGLDLAVGYGKLFVPYSVLQDLKNNRATHKQN